jgi:hypothetical protein
MGTASENSSKLGRNVIKVVTHKANSHNRQIFSVTWIAQLKQCRPLLHSLSGRRNTLITTHRPIVPHYAVLLVEVFSGLLFGTMSCFFGSCFSNEPSVACRAFWRIRVSVGYTELRVHPIEQLKENFLAFNIETF